ncbi:hypothetical protein Tsubulata_026590 [Turnera subulata]|uniref:Uncharacterized protein n=1 Tax=Turnera subulata TaxID=218843 RepID=A0A9Q0JIW9_9ROSI|nr:hypothetical protein Tsubulata_026590 [Turnera subulata]
MSLRYNRFRQVSRLLPHICPGNGLQNPSRIVNCTVALPQSRDHGKITHPSALNGAFRPWRWYSTTSQVAEESPSSEANALLSFIESAFTNFKGPNHCWLNTVEGNVDFFKKDRIFLVLAGQFLEDSLIVPMLEHVKLIQQRFPEVHVMGLHYESSNVSASDKTSLYELIMEEYITFPILVSSENFLEIGNGACYVLFKNFNNPVIYNKKTLDLGMLNKGCVSADESGDHIFLSDSNHHRIIVADGSGKILDCIGSSPGFEDGEFESAKLARPAASFYNDDEDCLYIVDSENHAIRRADMERRVLETLYPTCSVSKKPNRVLAWIKDKLGFGSDPDPKSEEFNPQSLVFPWHLVKLEDNSFLIMSRSFEALWIMDSASGEIREHIEGFPKIFETYGQLITEKASIMKQFPSNRSQQHNATNYSLEGFPYASHISSITTFQNHVIKSDASTSMWIFYLLPLDAHLFCGAWTDHFECFTLLPGRIDMRVNIDIPVDTELVEPLQEGCVWRQARGAATEVLGAKGVVGSSEKVGIAQQWYDELDSLSFSTIEPEISVEEDETSTNVRSQDEKVHIDCAVNTSPGTSEVVIHAALYLKLKRHSDLGECSREKYAARMADILNRGSRSERDTCLQLLLKSSHDLMDYILMRPLHVRIKLNSLDHPKADNGKDIVLTDSSVEVNVSLET